MLKIDTNYHGDCYEIHKQIDDKSVDMIFTDCPYNTTRASWDTNIDLEKLWQDYNRIVKENGVILMFSQSPFDKILACSNLKQFRYEWIWEKTQATGHLNSKKMPMKCHENILVFYKKLPKYFPQMTEGHTRKVSSAKHKQNTTHNQTSLYNKFDNFTDYDSTTRYPRDILKFASDKQKCSIHETQKPIALCEYLIKTYSEENDIILDSFSGSCSIGLSAKNLNRRFINIELDETHFNNGLKRINT
jgi:DNA modification methylase